MTDRFIDTFAHNLTAPQVVEQLKRHFAEDRFRPVLILIRPGECEKWMPRIRVALSRSWKSKSDVRHGLRNNEPFDTRHPVFNDRCECVPVYYHMNLTQRVKPLLSTINF